MAERLDPYVPKEPADIKRSTPRHVIEELAGPSDRNDKTCLYGSGCLLPEDIPEIARFLGISETKLHKRYIEPVTKHNTTLHKPRLLSKPHGQCIFYDKNKGCTVHDVKPYQCRIASRNHHGEKIIEWFDANFFLNPKDTTSLREWHSRLKFKKTIPGALMEDLVPDKEIRDRIIRGEPVKL